MKAADCAEEVQGAAHAFEVLGVGEPEMLSYTVPHDGIERAPRSSAEDQRYSRKNIRAALRKFRPHRSETIRKVYPLYGNYRGYFFCPKISISSRFFVGNDRYLSYKADCAVDFACLSAKIVVIYYQRATTWCHRDTARIPCSSGTAGKGGLTYDEIGPNACVREGGSRAAASVFQRSCAIPISRGDISTRRRSPRSQESIRQYGVLNPLTVRRAPGGGYELVAGERR